MRRYRVRLDDGGIFVDLTEPPPEAVRAKAVAGLGEAFGEHDYERLARELARFVRAGGDPATALSMAFAWAKDGFEFGMTHAQAAAPDWLGLRDRLPEGAEADRLVPVLEIIGHLSWDVLMQPGVFPFVEGAAAAFDADCLEAAIERQDEDAAVRLVRAALRVQPARRGPAR